jgi:STE24 endopeptidase
VCTTESISLFQVNLLLIFLVFGLLFQYEAMYHAFGFQHEKPILIGLVVVLQFIFSPYNAVRYVVSKEVGC